MNAPVTYPDTRALRGIFDAVAPRYQRSEVFPGGAERLRPSAGWQVARENGPAAHAVNGAVYLSPASLLDE
jgi:hypothetical protein